MREEANLFVLCTEESQGIERLIGAGDQYLGTGTDFYELDSRFSGAKWDITYTLFVFYFER